MKSLLHSPQVKEGGLLHERMLEGISDLALAVGSTLGPKGRTVIIDRPETPIITKDGVTVAANIQFADPVKNAGAKLLQAAAKATAAAAGDGTTTATVLAHAIYVGGLRLMAAGVSPIALQVGIEAGMRIVSQFIRSVMAVEIPDAQIGNVATVAANGDTHVGQLIAEAMAKVGRQGLINLESSTNGQTWLEVRDSFNYDIGAMAVQYFNQPDRGQCIFQDPLVLLSERPLTQGVSQPGQKSVLHDLGPILNAVATADRPLLVIAPDVTGDAQATLMVNNQRGILKVCCVRPPGLGDSMKAALDDMALLTGATVLQTESGMALSRFTIDNLGTCKRAIVTGGQTVLEGAGQNPEDVKLRASSLRNQAEHEADPRAREQLYQRAARLTGSCAVLHIGADTDTEQRELADRVEDSVLAVRAALAEGIVPGGGLALHFAARVVGNLFAAAPDYRALKKEHASKAAELTAHQADHPEFAVPAIPAFDPQPMLEGIPNLTADQLMGVKLLLEALDSPIRQIATNAGVSPDVVIENIYRLNQHHDSDNHAMIGYNAATGHYGDLVKQGIVDPAKVVRLALEKSASIASAILGSSTLVYLDPRTNPAAQAPTPFVSPSVLAR